MKSVTLSAAAVAGVILLLPDVSVSSLLIASYRNTIEHTPQQIALEDFRTGEPSPVIVNSGVPSMMTNNTIDLAGNAQTQALRAFPTNRNLRIIYTIVEVAYRLVASRKSGVASLSDLRGKKIGTFVNTSGQYFIEKLLAGAGVLESEYAIVNGTTCNIEPCGPGSLPHMLGEGEVDAVGVWEPTQELAVRRLGGADGAIEFRDRRAYRELYSIHTTAEKLADPAKRAEIAAFVRAIYQAQRLFREDPGAVILRVARIAGLDPEVLEGVWGRHDWDVTLPPDLLDVLVEEERWIAKLQGRKAMSAEELAVLIDASVLQEALDLAPSGAERGLA